MTRRDRLALTVILVAAALGAFWFLGLGSKRKDADALGAKVTVQEARRDLARSNLATYQAARGSYRTNYATVARLGKAVPADNDVPSLIYQVESTAQASGIDFQSLKVSASTPTPTAAPAAPPAGTSDPNATAAAATTPTAPAAPAFTTVPFTFTFNGSFFKLSSFFERLQDYIQSTNKRVTVSGRLMALDGIDLAAGPGGFPAITATAQATTYLVPADQGLFNGADPTAPAAGAPPAAASTPAPSGGSALSPAPATVMGPK
jgi:pyruvate/2-oxoglutarate dehydrogenase complex dihydrolipoamide acyltransferase (E2) component